MKYIYLSLTLIAVFLPSCKPHKVTEQEELIDYFNKRVIRLEHNLKRNQEKEKSLAERLAVEKEKAMPAVILKENIAKLASEQRKTISSLAELEAQVEGKVALLDAYKRSFRPKLIASETDLGEVTLANGDTFKDAVIQEISTSGMKLKHANGFSTVPFAEIPESISSGFVVAPSPADSDIDPEQVLARRPRLLKTEEDIENEREAANRLAERERNERTQNLNDKLAAKRMEEAKLREMEARERAGKLKRQEAYDRNVDLIRSEILTLQNAISQQQSQRSETSYKMQNSPIAVSAADQKRTLQAYDEKIAALEEKVREMERRIVELPSP